MNKNVSYFADVITVIFKENNYQFAIKLFSFHLFDDTFSLNFGKSAILSKRYYRVSNNFSGCVHG